MQYCAIFQNQRNKIEFTQQGNRTQKLLKYNKEERGFNMLRAISFELFFSWSYFTSFTFLYILEVEMVLTRKVDWSLEVTPEMTA